jgi:hypothetical protein
MVLAFAEGERTEERGLPMVHAQVAAEAGVGDEVVPAGADEGGMGERGRLWREAN